MKTDRAALTTRASRSLLAAFVVAYFSGLWPHIKLVATLVMWFRPEGERERGRWLYYQGLVAVWSYLDIAVVIFIAVAFHASIVVNIPNLVNAVFAVAVWPCVGAYKFCVAVFGEDEHTRNGQRHDRVGVDVTPSASLSSLSPLPSLPEPVSSCLSSHARTRRCPTRGQRASRALGAQAAPRPGEGDSRAGPRRGCRRAPTNEVERV